MKCPNCGKEIDIGDTPYNHMMSYYKSVLVATKCCGGPVRCYPEFTFSVEEYFGGKEKDDWGTPFNKSE